MRNGILHAIAGKGFDGTQGFIAFMNSTLLLMTVEALVYGKIGSVFELGLFQKKSHNTLSFFSSKIAPLTPLLYHTTNLFASVLKKKKALFSGFF
jgi:hypothetical protein